MKRIFIGLVVALSTLSVAKPVDLSGLSIRANVGILKEKDGKEEINEKKPLYGSVGLEVDYAIPVYSFNEKTSVEVAPGMDFEVNIFKKTVAQHTFKQINYELVPNVSVLASHKINDDLTIKGGLNLGLGLELITPGAVKKGDVSTLVAQTTNAKIILDYKHFSTSLEGGYELYFNKNGKILSFPVRLGMGYAF